MAKNDRLINAVRDTMRIAKQDQYIKEMMASFALTLHYGTDLPQEAIEELLSDVNKIWNISVIENKDVLKWCLDEVNIDIERKGGV